MPALTIRVTLLLIVFSGLAACAAQEVLPLYSAVPPEGVDFSGTWKIRRNESADRRSIGRAIDNTDGAKNSTPGDSANSASRASSSRRPPRSSYKGGLVHVFLETGEQLQVKQTPYAFFVSIDRSVVEEFRFGERRVISVGEIEAQRVSGWEGEVYVVETLDKNGMKLREKFWLGEEGSLLLREITFRGRNQESSPGLLQVFDKID